MPDSGEAAFGNTDSAWRGLCRLPSLESFQLFLPRALLLKHPEAIKNPFCWRRNGRWIPMLDYRTLATVIACRRRDFGSSC